MASKNQANNQIDSVTGLPAEQKNTNGAAHVTSPNWIEMMDEATDPLYIYFGSAPSGTLLTATGWTLSRMTIATSCVYPAVGSVSWNGRVAATYSTGV